MSNKQILTFTFVLASFFTMAQANYSGYDMAGIPQTLYSNPAFRPDAKFFIGLPVISNVNASYNNTSFSFNDIFVEEPGTDSLFLDLSKLAHSNNKINYISGNASVELLSFGFKTGSAFLSFGVNTNFNTRIFYNSDLIKLLWEGNGGYINDDIVLSKTGVFQEHYNKYYAGMSVPVGKYADIGIRVGFVQGLSSVYTVNNNVILKTVVDTLNGVYFTGETDYELNTSTAAYLFGDSASIVMNKYFVNFNNSGLSLDAGVNVKVNKRLAFQLSVNNLGFITWRTYNKTYSSKNKNVYFDGVEYDFFDENNGDDPVESYLNALDSIFKIKESVKVYSSNLRGNIFANGQFSLLNPQHRFNILFAGRFLEEDFEYAVSAGYTYNPAGKFSAKLSYTYIKHSPLNIGAAFFFNFKPFQIYMMADNITGIIRWYDTYFADLRFGINILIPAKKVEEIPFETE